MFVWGGGGGGEGGGGVGGGGGSNVGIIISADGRHEGFKKDRLESPSVMIVVRVFKKDHLESSSVLMVDRLEPLSVLIVLSFRFF